MIDLLLHMTASFPATCMACRAHGHILFLCIGVIKREIQPPLAKKNLASPTGAAP
jgi:hypothetical protein